MQNSDLKLNVLFIGDIFGDSGIQKVKDTIPKLKTKYPIDLIIAQAENVSGRKGLDPKEYNELKEAGIDIFTLGNHVWAKKSINEIINNDDILRPYNVNKEYPGKGTNVYYIRNIKIRVTSLLGITFNPLNYPWKQSSANNFFDAVDEIIKDDDSDFHIIDFHAETTSEKNVLALYLDGKVSALLGTHTHIQTNDAKIFKNNLAYITDVGMTGPVNSAIGANFQEVYEKMRFNSKSSFQPSTNKSEFNAVFLSLHPIGSKHKSKIKLIKIK